MSCDFGLFLTEAKKRRNLGEDSRTITIKKVEK